MRREKTIITCDRCGKSIDEDIKMLDFVTTTIKRKRTGEITNIEYEPYIKELSPKSLYLIFAYGKTINKYDLCPECKDKFLKFMKGEK